MAGIEVTDLASVEEFVRPSCDVGDADPFTSVLTGDPQKPSIARPSCDVGDAEPTLSPFASDLQKPAFA